MLSIRPSLLRTPIAGSLAVAALFLVPACEDSGRGSPESGGNADAEQQAAGEQDESNPYRFEVWSDEFPFSVRLPPRVLNRTYDRTPRQALDSILEKVAGRGSKAAYDFARRFFDRLDPAYLDLVVDELGEALSAPNRSTDAQNLLDALGASASPRAAEAALRALDHRDPEVRNRAMSALSRVGSADDVLGAWNSFPDVFGRGALAWINAAIRVLPSDELVPRLRSVVDQKSFQPVFPQIIDAMDPMDPSDKLAVFGNYVGRYFDALEVPMKIWRHQAGDSTGTAEVKELLKDARDKVRAETLLELSSHATEEQLLPLVDVLLERVSTEPSRDARIALADVLGKIEGEYIDDSIETLAFDAVPQVRRRALWWLSQREIRGELDELMQVVATGTGTTARSALEELIHAQYVPALSVINRRMLTEEPIDRGDYLRALCLTCQPEAIEFVRDAFFSDWIGDDVLRNISIWMSNLAGSEFVVLEMFESCAKDDLLRRALLLRTMTNMAGIESPDGDEFRQPLRAKLRKMLADPEEMAQMRIFALDELKDQFGLGDVIWLSRLGRSSEPAMRALINSFLFEFF
ncbi:MAG: HEAT repeat domain-containing protein [Planctomycetota bacterium]